MSDLLKWWFKNHTANKNLANLSDITETMQEGCWYRADVPGTELSVISIDTLYYNNRNKMSVEEEGAK